MCRVWKRVGVATLLSSVQLFAHIQQQRAMSDAAVGDESQGQDHCAVADEVRKLAMSSGLLKEYATHADGDCLFSSVAAIMRAAGPAHQQVIDGHIARHGMRFKCGNVKPEVLRVAVALTVLDEKDSVMNAALTQWVEIAKCAKAEGDRQLLVEYHHVLHVLKDSQCGTQSVPLTRAQREQVFNAMCSKSYWGEQIALQILRRITGIALVVLDAHAKLMYQFNESDAEASTQPEKVYALLRLSGRHYQPLGHGDRMSFFEHELPYVLAVALTSPHSSEKVSDTLKRNVQEAQRLFVSSKKSGNALKAGAGETA